MLNIFRIIMILCTEMALWGEGAIAHEITTKENFEGLVLNTFSGDSIEVMKDDGFIITAHLWGVKSPALGSYFGKESQKQLESLVISSGSHKKVILVPIDDQYLVYRKEDYLFLNREQVRQGGCWLSDRYVGCLADSFYGDMSNDLVTSECEACREYRGIWSIGRNKKVSIKNRVSYLRKKVDFQYIM